MNVSLSCIKLFTRKIIHSVEDVKSSFPRVITDKWIHNVLLEKFTY